MTECLFCKIIAGDIPAYIVYEDENCIAFLDSNPTNPGHTLVVPNVHSRNALAMTSESFSTLAQVIHTLAPILQKSTRAEGTNIIFNNEAAAGQVIFHTHAHIVPRFKKDGHHWWTGTPYGTGEAEKIAEKIRKELCRIF